MPDQTRRTAARIMAAAGATAGFLLLTRPQQVLDAVAPAFPRERAWLARALGARLVVQHGTALVRPDRAVVTAGAGLDLLHAASMLPFLASTRYGSAARVSGAGALVSALLARATAPRPARR